MSDDRGWLGVSSTPQTVRAARHRVKKELAQKQQICTICFEPLLRDERGATGDYDHVVVRKRPLGDIPELYSRFNGVLHHHNCHMDHGAFHHHAVALILRYQGVTQFWEWLGLLCVDRKLMVEDVVAVPIRNLISLFSQVSSVGCRWCHQHTLHLYNNGQLCNLLDTHDAHDVVCWTCFRRQSAT